MWTHARLLERREFERLVDDGPAGSVVAALRAYVNADGGLGHALEPDLRTSTSQPLFVDFAVTTLLDADTNDPAMLAGACEFLASIADAGGAIPYVLPCALCDPRADHWNGDYAVSPSLRSTAGVVGRLHALGAAHAWLSRATEWCFQQIAGRPVYTGHGMLNVLTFLEYVPDRDRARALWTHVTSRLFEADYVLMELRSKSYGLSPLRFAPSPGAAMRSLFADSLIDDHLDALLADQQEDGGWPIRWDPPGSAAVSEWRGKWTLDALRVLRAYGRL